MEWQDWIQLSVIIGVMLFILGRIDKKMDKLEDKIEKLDAKLDKSITDLRQELSQIRIEMQIMYWGPRYEAPILKVKGEE